MKKVIMMLLGIAFAAVAWADPSVVIQKPAEGEFLGFVSAFEGFSLPLQLGASDADFNNPDGFAVKVTSGEYTLYDKSDILFRKEYPTDLEINEGLHYDPENLIQTATITVKTPDGRVTTRTFTFGLLPSGGVLVHNLDEVNDAIKTAKEEEWWDLVFVKTNDFPIASGKKIALPTLEEESKIYFAGDGKLDVSSIVPTFGTPYDVVTNFTTNNFVQVFEEWEYDEELGKWVDVTNVYTTVEKQLAQFSNTNDVAKLVFDAKRKTISLIGRGESEDYPWILDAATNVTAWVDANKKLVIDNGLLANSYDIHLVAMTNNFAKYSYTAPANALVKVVNGSTTNTVTSAGWVGENGTYATLGDALKAGEAKVLPGYAVSYDANGAAGVMSNDVFAVNRQVTLKANAFSAIGYDFAGWTLDTNTTVIADSATVKDLASVDGSATLTAQWNATGVSIDAFDVLTNTLVAVTNQAASLPVTITLTGEIAVPQDCVITVYDCPEITFAGEGTLDVSAIVPTFGTPTVVGEGFTSTNAPALFDTKGVSKLVYEDGTVSVVARGETEDFPWVLDAATNVTAWVESSNLVISNGLTAESYEIDLVALTNNVATYSYTPASPLNAVVKVGEADYKTPKCWIGESGSYATLGAALEAGETTVLPGYEVVYEANGAAGSMTNSYFASATEATLTANAFSAVGYDFAGWATNGVDEVVYADAATVQDLAPVDGSATLTAQWNVNSNGVTVTSFEALTNAIATAGLQGANLPITIGFTSAVTIPEDAALPTLPTGTGYDGLKYVAEKDGGSNLWVEDGVLYGDVLRGEVPVDALVLMQHATGGSITEFKALSEGEDSAIVTNDVVMLLGDNGKAYFNDTDSVDQMIADILAADPRPTCVKLYEVKGAMVTFEAMGGTIEDGTDPLGNDYAGGGETVTYLCLPDSGYQLPTTERTGYMFAGWFDSWKPGANEVTNNQEIVDYSEHSLYAQWISTAPTPKAGELHVEDVTNDVPVSEIAAKAYVNMTDITTVTTPLYLKTIGNRAFMGCTALEKLTITATRDYETLEPTKVTIEQNAFSGCMSLGELLIAGEIEKIGQSAFQNCAKLKKISFRGDEAIAYDPGAFYRCGYANGTDELKVYMSSAFQAANAQLLSDFQTWNTQVKIIDKIDVEPVTGEMTVSIDPAGLVAGKRVAIVVQTSVKGTPDKDDVDIELSTDLATWTPIAEGVEKTAYPDGTVMIEITVPNAPSGFFRAVVK